MNHIRQYALGAIGGAMLSMLAYAFLSTWLDQVEWTQAMTPQPVPQIAKPGPEYSYAMKMRATWYGSRYEGRKTASGRVFNSEELVAAHRSIPFGSRLLVAYQGRQVEVEVIDRMPAGPDSLDLSAAAFRAIAPLEQGVAHVQVSRRTE